MFNIQFCDFKLNSFIFLKLILYITTFLYYKTNIF
jgi:hypothetical protein